MHIFLKCRSVGARIVQQIFCTCLQRLMMVPHFLMLYGLLAFLILSGMGLRRGQPSPRIN